MDWQEANQKLIGKRIKVRNSPHQNWEEREAELFFKNGIVRCVNYEQENIKKNGDVYLTHDWVFWRLIPEKTKRPITNKELIEAGANWVFNPSGDRYNIIQIDINSSGIYYLCRGVISSKYIRDLIEAGYTWSSSTEPNVRRSFEVEE
jgi:hypothetical protein